MSTETTFVAEAAPDDGHAPAPGGAQGFLAGGLAPALVAFLMWGLLPLYLRTVHHVPPFEFVGWRVLCTLPVCLGLVAWRGQFAALRAAFARPRTLAIMTGSALLIGFNWLVYIAAIQWGHVYAASIGYYINPLVNVVLGTLFLGEKLGRGQWLAVGIAALGVAALAAGAGQTLAISVLLAASFAAYGLVRKLAPVEALVGLTVETLLLTPVALGWLGWLALGHRLAAPAGSTVGTAALALSGLVTAIPLMMFATAARRLDYSTLGFVQFMTPTIVFLLGLFVFHETLKPAQLASLSLIWVALAVFCADLVRQKARSRKANQGA